MVEIAPTLAAIAVTASPAAGLHVDVTGDGAFLVIRTESGVSYSRLPGRLDGAFRVGDTALLLIRQSVSSYGVSDAVYRVRGRRIERVHVDGPYGDGLVTELVGRTYVDIDCGTRPHTVVQVEQEPTAHGWRGALLTFSLRGRHLRFTRVVRSRALHARQCAVMRR